MYSLAEQPETTGKKPVNCTTTWICFALSNYYKQVVGKMAARNTRATASTPGRDQGVNIHKLAGLVETSNNLAAANPSQDGSSYKIVTSSRSSIGAALESQRVVIAKAAKLCGASCEQDNAYPGWAPNPASKVVKLTQEVMESVTGKAPKVRHPPRFIYFAPSITGSLVREIVPGLGGKPKQG
jgi:hypothetical protein